MELHWCWTILHNFIGKPSENKEVKWLQPLHSDTHGGTKKGRKREREAEKREEGDGRVQCNTNKQVVGEREGVKEEGTEEDSTMKCACVCACVVYTNPGSSLAG